jgi:hypothetical protein
MSLKRQLRWRRREDGFLGLGHGEMADRVQVHMREVRNLDVFREEPILIPDEAEGSFLRRSLACP